MTKETDGGCTLVACIFLVASLLAASAVHSAGSVLLLGTGTVILSIVFYVWRKMRNLSFWVGCSIVAAFCVVSGFLYGAACTISFID